MGTKAGGQKVRALVGIEAGEVRGSSRYEPVPCLRPNPSRVAA